LGIFLFPLMLPILGVASSLNNGYAPFVTVVHNCPAQTRMPRVNCETPVTPQSLSWLLVWLQAGDKTEEPAEERGARP